MTTKFSSFAYKRWLQPAALVCAMTAALPVLAQQHPGGIIESSTNAQSRPALSQSQINSFLPNRGAFTFPAPYNTQAVRLTNASDCGGQDCINYAGYSYWRNINNHVGEDSMLIFVGMEKRFGGKGPSLLKYNKITDALTDLGPLFPGDQTLSWATGEGWYFSATKPTALYLNSGARLKRLDVISGELETVVDLNAHMGSGHYIWQAHSSDDDRVHSATVRSTSNYQSLGCMTYNSHTGSFNFYSNIGDYDECQIDRSGDWLLIKEDVDGRDGEDNRIINMITGEERVLLDRDGAGGHSDMGHGYMVAADNWANDPNTWKLWDFTRSTLTGETVYRNNDWNVFAPAHVSHSNARPNVAPQHQFACGSAASRGTSVHANEIMCFNLDGSRDTLVVAPVMTDMNAAGGGNDYARVPKGNLDITGKYFFWTSNTGGSRLDAFLVKVPDHKLTGVIDHTPPPGGSNGNGDTGENGDTGGTGDTGEKGDTGENGTTPPPSDSGQTNGVVWTDIVRSSVAGSQLTKTAGCDGCPDAGAVSTRQITEGVGYMEFSAADGSSMLIAGLSNKHSGTNGAQIDLGIRLQGGTAEVRERGAYRADTPYQKGDTFRISVQDGVVSYAKNGVVFYSNTLSVSYPLSGAAALYSLGASIENVVISTASTPSAPGESEDSPSNPVPGKTDLDITASPELGQANDVVWTDTVRVDVVGSRLLKSSGCNGCGDAGAFSIQQIMSGNGYMEFAAGSTRGLMFAGLTRNHSGTDGRNIDFGIRMQGGYAEVRERGVYRSETSFNAGDKFRISVQDGRVSYARNGVVFYQSTRAPQYPLAVGTAFYSTNTSIEDVVLSIDSAPQISDLSVKANGSTAVTLQWNTDKRSESLVQYGESSIYTNETGLITTPKTVHTAELSGLKPGTRYHVRVFARDARGNISSTSDYSFVTPR